MDRLREAYLALANSTAVTTDERRRRRLREAKVIDLRDPQPDVLSRSCSTDGHGDVTADTRCSRCHEVYCRRCILQSAATHDKPLCTECALIVSGVHHKRTRQPAAPKH